MNLDYSVLGKRIASRRMERRIKQNALAENIHISNNYLSSIERGKERPSLEIFVDICRELEVTPDYLLLGVMHPCDIPANIFDQLRLCSEEDIALVAKIVEFMVEKNSLKWNNDNYF